MKAPMLRTDPAALGHQTLASPSWIITNLNPGSACENRQADDSVKPCATRNTHRLISAPRMQIAEGRPRIFWLRSSPETLNP